MNRRRRFHRHGRRSPFLPAAAASVLTALLVGAAVWTLKPAPVAVEPRVTRSLIAVDPFDQRPRGGTRRNRAAGAAAGPDGPGLVARRPHARVQRHTGCNINPGGWIQSALYVRPLDSLTARPIATTTGADSPFFSPDGMWIGYVDGSELRRVPATAGEATATTITPLPNRRQRIAGASWGDQGFIVFATADGLWRVAASGGTPERIVEAGDNESARLLPQVLPGSQWMLFTVQRTPFRWDDAQIVARSLVNGEEKVLLTDASDARYVSSGHLVFLRRGKLMAVPFDANRVTLAGASSRRRGRRHAGDQHVEHRCRLGRRAVRRGGRGNAGVRHWWCAARPGQGSSYRSTALETMRPSGPPQGPFSSQRLSPDRRRIVVYSG